MGGGVEHRGGWYQEGLLADVRREAHRGRYRHLEREAEEKERISRALRR
jgi:hypothetical protein